jgi:hypothetical protein
VLFDLDRSQTPEWMHELQPILAGALGYEMALPKRKLRSLEGELTEEQKQENRALSQSRVVCEAAFAGIKRYGAVSQIYRNRIEDFDDHLMLTAAGLWNFYLSAA